MTQAITTKPRTVKQPRRQPLPPMSSPEWIARRNAEMMKRGPSQTLDQGDPQGAVGHAYGIHKTTWLIRAYRELHRKLAMDITPQQVVDVLVKAGVKKWVLMGLHGYIGYFAEPRTTQDVDIMVAPSERKKSVKAIQAEWPTLIVEQYSEVVRFKDPNDLGPDGRPKSVIDIMNPWASFQQTILKEHVLIDKITKHRIPRLEAALVAKYAAMISAMRVFDKKQQDAVDFRRMVRANFDRIDREVLRTLAEEVWSGGADDVEQLVEKTIRNEAFTL